jgi:hypothetical protein
MPKEQQSSTTYSVSYWLDLTAIFSFTEGFNYAFMVVSPAGRSNEYRRVGIGFAPRNCIVKLEKNVCIT